jgi:hypothetical protein
MSCREAGMNEDAAFRELLRAVEHRKKISAKMAIFDDHWAGYEAALKDLETALHAYTMAMQQLQEARANHKEESLT